jgi:hypothetical protein
MNQLRYLIKLYGVKQNFIAEVTGMTEQRITKLKTLSDEEYMDKVYASEYLKLKNMIELR